MTEKPQLKGALVPVILVGVFFLLALMVPALAPVAGIFSPALLIFVYLQRGRQVGWILVGLVFFALLTMMGAWQAILFFVEYAILALILAETIRLGLSLDRCIFFSALGSAVLSILLLFTALNEKDASMMEFFQGQIQKHFEQSMVTMESMGESPEDLGAMREMGAKFSSTLAMAYPAFIVVGSLIAAIGNYFLVRFIWIRLYGSSVFFSGSISEWVLPEYFIWPLIVSGGLVFWGHEFLGAVGMNVFIVTLVVYFFQGLAVTFHFLESKNVPVFFWALILILIVIQPLLIGLAVGLGVFDIWIDFRKLKAGIDKSPES